MAYFLIHFRFIGLVFASPIFSMAVLPMPSRYIFAVILTVASAPAVNDSAAGYVISLVLFDSWVSVLVIVLREFLIGTALGLLAALPLSALYVAGEKIGMSMGFAMASTMDPMTQQQTSMISQMMFMVGLWFYFRWNGHLLMVQAVVESLRFIPLASMSLMPAGDMGTGEWFTALLVMAMRMVLPFYCAILLADVGLGFLARTVPQMNIFVLGLPLKVALGFFVLMLALPLTIELIFNYVEPWIEFALASATAWR
ncbi:MAG: flagellar biosynthetic protein FliR [Synergistaceae bacterium]|nr:flagellar biosynthetic protein FliR [Synergistaceae bacterium]